ncbi:uncharacterized protein EV422DRAFT_517018 [Fimicolochytrium jonesii]|uniref:uncharacterized protein n=1 Tax=Fimicolochytrium jonesii TaxID=1396493 RepID=UPI0022FE8E70|nr:uncharacterized protein EV422DRAFT_517018 [Fimicolochytrium jonesii]KAI8824991.1 hypothetical protein EV422DRAFT_517018 [Fimicolochytrium jonesii]
MSRVISDTILGTHVLAFFSIFTFYLPLYFWALPNVHKANSLQHNVPVTVHMQHNLNNKVVFLPCPAISENDMTALYTKLGICYSPMQFEGLCDGKMVQTTWIDLTYVRGTETMRDTEAIKEAPKPFNFVRYQELCARDWLFDPSAHKFVDNSRVYCAVPDDPRRNYVACQDYWNRLNIVLIIGSGFGALAVASLVSFVAGAIAVGTLIYNASRRLAGFEEVPLKGKSWTSG